MSKLEDVVAFILNKPGYIKWGKEKLAERLKVSAKDIQKAKDYINYHYHFDDIDREYYPKEEIPSMGERVEIPEPEAAKDHNENINENKVREEEFSYEDMSLEEYCDWVGLDYEMIDPYKDVKYWTDASGRRRYSVVPRVDTRGITKQKFIDDIRQSVQDVKAIVPNTYAFEYEETDVIGILNPTDAHIDKLCYVSDGRTIRDNINDFQTAILTQAHQLKNSGCTEVYLILGNDLWDTNDANSTTKRGTPQELNTTYRNSYRAGITAIVEIINSMIGLDLKVVLVIIEGNHDEDKVFHLGVALQLLYEHSDVKVLYNDVVPRQYIKFGENLIGFGHGYHEKKMIKQIPLLMAEEAKAYWSSTSNRIFFLGDIHQQAEYSFLRAKDYRGVHVRFLRDIAMGTSLWDAQHGYHTSPRSTEAFLIHKTNGQIATFPYNF